jgi:GNAT superfamily N-acetyltransferase
VSRDVDIEVHNELCPDDEAVIRRALDQYNQSAGPFDEIRPLRCFARNSSGELIGGAVGHTWGSSSELGQIFVNEPERRKGLGSRLLERFESEARARGAINIYLDTFSFHALDFYLAHRYEIACQFDGLPQGAVLYILRKPLAAA